MVVNSTFPVNGTAVCELSPHAACFSTVLGTIVGTIISGVTGGLAVSFIIVCFAWFATLRILLVGLWQVGVVLLLKPTRGGKQWYGFARHIIYLMDEGDLVRGEETSSDDVDILGWFGWVWSVCYAPPIQVLWLVTNWSSASPSLLFARSLCVSVVALPLSMDTRARYGRALGKKIGGKVTEWLFSVVTTVGLVTLGVISAIELGMYAVKHSSSSKTLMITEMVFLLLVFGWGSLVGFPPLDVPLTATSLRQVKHGFVTGCIAGVIMAALSMVEMDESARSPGLSVLDYIKCQSIPWWERALAVLP